MTTMGKVVPLRPEREERSSEEVAGPRLWKWALVLLVTLGVTGLTILCDMSGYEGVRNNLLFYGLCMAGFIAYIYGGHRGEESPMEGNFCIVLAFLAFVGAFFAPQLAEGIHELTGALLERLF